LILFNIFLGSHHQTKSLEKEIETLKKELKQTSKQSILQISSLFGSQCRIACGLDPSNIQLLSEEISYEAQHIFEFFYLCRQGLSQSFSGVLANKKQVFLMFEFI
jgi:hypothetical protein